jgi:hypothetical protein
VGRNHRAGRGRRFRRCGARWRGGHGGERIDDATQSSQPTRGTPLPQSR